MSEGRVAAGSRSRNGQVTMNLLTFFFHFHQVTITIPVELVGAVQALAAQEGVTPNELLVRIIRETVEQRQAIESVSGRWERLTPRQQEIAILTGQNLTNAQIAARLGISEATVKTHQTHILDRLNLRSRYHLRQALEALDLSALGE
jgi:DNA-binding NarL/FixJ family response regulator